MTYRTSTLGRLALVASLGLAATAACGGGSEMDTDSMAGAGGSDGTGGGATSTGGTTTTTGGSTSEGGGAGEGGAGTGGGTDTGTGGSEPQPPDGPTLCNGDGDCADLDQVCAMMRSICVDCVTSGDCDDGEVCEHNECEARPVCEDSLDCPSTDLVCVEEGGDPGPGSGQGVCLECGSPADCDEEESCVNNVCVRGCASDKDCTPLGMLCDFDSGSCALCLNAADCDEGEYCLDGACMEAVCTPGETACIGDDIATCNEIGSGYGDVDPCFDGACDVVDGEATCVEDEFGP